MYQYGALPDLPDRRDYPYHEHRAAAQAASGERELPERIDNRDECTAVWQQLGPDCVGQALVGIGELLYWRKLGVRPAFSPTAAYRWAQAQGGIVGSGARMRDGLKAWVKQGMCPLLAWHYQELKSKPGAAALALRYPLRRYEKLDGVWETKHAIHRAGAVVATLEVHPGWEQDPLPYNRIPAGETAGEFHAVMLSGYDDHHGGLWVRNSWGQGWGAGGYALLPYDDFQQNAVSVWLPSLTNGWWSRLTGLFRG